MSDWLRRAGTGRLPDGRVVSWSLADGRRGRRWRWTIASAGGIEVAALAELAPDGTLARLELATSAGMLTLHPEPDGRSIHGNVVSIDGVRPLAFRWNAGGEIGLAEDPFGTAILAGGGAGGGPGARGAGGDGEVRLVVRGSLHLTADGAASALARDARGVPLLADASEWELEPE